VFFSVAECFHCKSRSRSIFLRQGTSLFALHLTFFLVALDCFCGTDLPRTCSSCLPQPAPSQTYRFCGLWTIVLPVPLHQRRTGQSRVKIHPLFLAQLYMLRGKQTLCTLRDKSPAFAPWSFVRFVGSRTFLMINSTLNVGISQTRT